MEGEKLEDTNHRKRAKSKPKKWLFIIVCALILLSLAGVAYETLSPKRHFASNNIPVASKPSEQASDQTKDSQFNVVLLGSDQHTQDEASRTDSIMVVHVNMTTKTYSIISIPRDTRVNLPGYGETKITHASMVGALKGGSKGAMQSALDAISNLTGLSINYYAETDYQGLAKMVDAVGGVEVNIPYKITLTHPWYKENAGKVFNPGSQQLDGRMATEIAHERYSLQNGDFGRQQTQELVLLAILKKATHPSNISELPKLVEAAHSFLIETNMSTQDMVSLGLGLKGLNTTDIHYYQLQGQSMNAMDPIVKSNLYYFVPDKAQLDKIIKEHFKN
jgi:polyisoprenyl-teichoic acid--peptidoglycan teichoic acid transferase